MANAEVFDSYFRRADLDKDGRISGQEAVGFFQGAGLPQMTLAKVRAPESCFVTRTVWFDRMSCYLNCSPSIRGRRESRAVMIGMMEAFVDSSRGIVVDRTYI